MAIAHDVSSSRAAWFATPQPATWSHPGAAGANIALVGVTLSTRNTDEITGVTYGGVAMTEIGSVPHNGSEDFRVYLFLLVDAAGGTQTVSVAHTGVSGAKWAACATMIADDTSDIQTALDTLAGTQANPQVSPDSGAEAAVRYSIIKSGRTVAQLTPISGMDNLEDYAQASRSARFARKTTAETGSASIGYTSTSDQHAMAGVAIWEGGVPGGGATASATVTVAALGQRFASDGASAAVAATSSGSGIKIGAGSGSASAAVSAAATGFNPIIPGGGAAVSVAVSAAATGADVPPIPSGGATSHAAVTVAAAGAKIYAAGGAAVNVAVSVRALGPFVAPPGYLNGDETLQWGVELAIGDGAVWGSALWSVDEWVGVDLEWVDVTDWVIRWSSQSATRATFNDSFRTGSATCRLQNWGGEWVGAGGAPGQVEIRPGVRIRAYLDCDGTRETLWTGYVSTQRESYGLQGEAITELQAIDALGRFGAIELSAGKLWNRGITTDVAVGRVLSAALWPNGTNWRTLSPGQHTVDDYEITDGEKALDLLRRLSEAEGGAIYTDRDSRIVFRDRDWLSSTKGAPPEYELGTIGGNEAQVRIMRPLIRSDQRIINEATLRRASQSSPAQNGHAFDLASKGKYGRRSIERTDLLCEDRDQAKALAERIVTNRREQRPEIESVSVRPPTSADALTLVQLKAGAVVEVKWTHPRNTWDVSGVGNLLGMKHKLDKSGLWEAELLLDATYQEA